MTNTYTLTPEDKKLIDQAKSAFKTDHSYLEQILWEARRRTQKAQA